MNELLNKVKAKKEFSGLPDSIVEKVLNEFNSSKESDEYIVKETRNKLRKYFGVFLTNKVAKPKNISDYDSVLLSHISSKKRNYNELYEFIFMNCKDCSLIYDFGCGVNGFSFEYIKKYFCNVKYLGFEATKQIVDNMNLFFEINKYSAKCVWCDLMNLEDIKNKLSEKGNKIFFCFQIVDALDKLEKNFSSKFLLMLKDCMSKKDFLILSFPVESLTGKQIFKDKRTKLIDFLEDNFDVVESKVFFGEKFLICRKDL